MQLSFTKMQGMGNDFIVIDAYTKALNLSKQQILFLANRNFGIGADQILLVEKSSQLDCDFKYRIFNADGSEVEHCGNGARCFMRYVLDKKLTYKNTIVVEIMKGRSILKLLANGNIEVEMGIPSFTPQSVNFITDDLPIKMQANAELYNIKDDLWIAIASMGNPHAVQIVKDVDNYPVEIEGKYLESNHRFISHVNVGFMQIIDKHNIKLRVFERGVGETLACGTGACAASICGIRQGLLSSPIKVQTRGGNLNIIWEAKPKDNVIMQGEAVIVFDGIINI